MIILDSSIWVAFFSQKDSQRQKAKEFFPGLKTQEIILLDHIYAEIMNVLRIRAGDEECIKFKRFLNIFRIRISLTALDVINMANIYFFQFKKLSFTDCIILASSKISNYEIATFDNSLQKASRLALKKLRSSDF